MAMIGELEDFGFSELLQILGRGGKSGQLSVWAPSGVAHIWFYQGRVVAASPPGECLTLEQRLCQNPELRSNCGGSTERVVHKLATLCCPINQPLGACLRKQGLISPAGLAMAFRQQLQDGVYALFELETGQFSFNAKAPMPYGEMTGLSKECLDIAVVGLRQLEKRQQQIRDLPDEEAYFSRCSDDLPLARLSSLEWSVWEQVSPHRQLRQIALELETDITTIQQTCGRLLQVGLIQETPYAPAPAQTSPSPVPSPPEEPLNSSLLNRLASVLRGIQKNGRQAYSGSLH